MKELIEDAVIVIGIAIGFLLFVIGIRKALKVKTARTLKDKFLIAVSFSLLSLSAISGLSKCVVTTCYIQTDTRPPSVKIEDIKEQERLLEEVYKEGKITKSVYDKRKEEILATKIDVLIKELWSENYDDKIFAQNALIEIGKPAIPKLKKTYKYTKDAKVKSVIEEIFKELGENIEVEGSKK